MTLSSKRIFVIGGTSGIGFSTAQAALEAGASVVVASNSAEHVEAAVARLGTGATGERLDITDEAGIEALFAHQAPFDHVVITAAKTKVAAVRELPLTDAYQSMNSKFWGAYRIARSATITKGGSLTFVSGFLSIRPQKGAAIQSAINAALEGLTRGLALELAPVRVNCVSPGLVMTEMSHIKGSSAMPARRCSKGPRHGCRQAWSERPPISPCRSWLSSRIPTSPAAPSMSMAAAQ
jgi:NAD(P)-dependent dehydrogenase (short-subunit alcohol dehydrogenase family)